MRTIFVYNPLSGSALRKTELLALLQKHGITINVWLPISKNFDTTLTQLVTKKYLVYVLGGDGTISSAASMIVGTSSILVPLPGGTLNHFTKDLGVPQLFEDALAGLKSHKDVSVDIASVNGTYFLNNSSIGIYAQSLKEREKIKSSLPKWLAIIFANIQALSRFHRYRLMVNDTQVRTPLLFVGNNSYSFAFNTLGSRSNLQSGTLTLAMTHTISRTSTILLAVKTLFGGGYKESQLDISYTKSVTVTMKQPKISVSHDGEMSVFETPLRYALHTAALNVRLPR